MPKNYLNSLWNKLPLKNVILIDENLIRIYTRTDDWRSYKLQGHKKECEFNKLSQKVKTVWRFPKNV